MPEGEVEEVTDESVVGREILAGYRGVLVEVLGKDKLEGVPGG